MRQKLVKDNHILLPKALIKFGEKKYIDLMCEKGEIRFSPSKSFNSNEQNLINDNYEANAFYKVSNIYYALLNEDTNTYGTPKKLANETIMRTKNNYVSKIPFSCYYYSESSVINHLFRIDNYDELVDALDEKYDTALIILNVPEYFERLKKINNIYFNYVYYVAETPTETEETNHLHFLFYKRINYKNQKEFRIALPDIQVENPVNINIGSISDIAFEVPMSKLKNGIILATSKEKMNELINEYGLEIKS